MKKVIFVLLMMGPLFLASILMHAQEKQRPIGIGVSLGKEVNFEEDGLPSLFDFPSFYLPLKISSSIRLEPEIGYSRYSYSDEYGENHYSLFLCGSGIFFVVQKEKSNIYLGARVGFMIFSYSYKYTYDGEISDHDSKTDFFVGPAIGGEYFFTKNVSLGGEVQVNYVNFGHWENRTASGSIIRTKPLIFLRWYF